MGWDEDRDKYDEQRLSLEDPNFLRKRCGGLKPGRLENTVQEGTILLRISFKEDNYQQKKKYLRRRLLPPH